MTIQELNKEIGNVDIYLLDQILKGRYPKDTKILDAGCGEGRNIIYFLNNQFNVFGIDQNPDVIRMIHFILGSTYSYLSKSNFIEGKIEELSHDDDSFELVICAAVLHFAKSKEHFETMFQELIRVLAPGGQIFIRTASDIGLHEKTPQKESGKFLLPDGSIRFLITEEMIHQLVDKYQLKFVEPIKTTNVNNLRCMTTLVLRK